MRPLLELLEGGFWVFEGPKNPDDLYQGGSFRCATYRVNFKKWDPEAEQEIHKLCQDTGVHFELFDSEADGTTKTEWGRVLAFVFSFERPETALQFRLTHNLDQANEDWE